MLITSGRVITRSWYTDSGSSGDLGMIHRRTSGCWSYTVWPLVGSVQNPPIRPSPFPQFSPYPHVAAIRCRVPARIDGARRATTSGWNELNGRQGLERNNQKWTLQPLRA